MDKADNEKKDSAPCGSCVITCACVQNTASQESVRLPKVSTASLKRMADRRALHYVFKIGNRQDTVTFYRDVLGMKFLRHEEFEKGCDAACNGPYDGKWSKSMVGYGPEDTHFVLELTYNYGIGSYSMGNDFLGISIESDEIVERVTNSNWPQERKENGLLVKSPDGHPFFVVSSVREGDPISMVTLAVSNLQKSVDYWQDMCGMNLFSKEAKSALLGYGENQCRLKLYEIDEAIERAKAYGRMAFACPKEQLPEIQRRMIEAKHTILTPLISLDTPGKATVEVVIPADPDGHEICFVGDEAFRNLSVPDPNAEQLINEAMAKDKSDEWFAKKGRSKVAE